MPSFLVLLTLCVLSAASFAPQLLRLWSRGDSSGISLVYVLFNLISATQQLTIGGLFAGFGRERPTVFIWFYPLSIIDWVNLAQLLIVWVCTLIVFIICCITSPNAPRAKSLAIIVYLFVLLATLVPLAVLYSDPAERTGEKNQMFQGHEMLYVAHTVYLLPYITFLVAIAFFPAARAILSRPHGDIGSLSLAGLLMQALVFAAVAVSWVYRVRWLENPEDLYPWSWYKLVGWAVVNNGIFAAIQALLFILAYTRTMAPHASTSEIEALLGRE